MDAMLAKALLERIAVLEEEVRKLKGPWTHNFGKMGTSGTSSGNYITGNEWNWNSTYTVTS